ncbi:MAG: glycosyltransferase family 4 protein [Bacteroidia bacterium]|nr:glycosyltransferase family 4 protein [Bacteroidia bacterium]
MKICFVLPHFHLEYTGGAETQCYYLARELSSRNWEVHYIRESGKSQSEVMDGIVVHPIPKRKSYLKWMNFLALRKQMKNIQADYWYTRANISYLFWMNLFARNTGGKVIWAFSRDSQLTPGGELERHGSPFIQAFHRINEWLFFRTLPKIDLILSQTKDQENLLKGNLGLSGQQIYNAHPVPHEESDMARKNTVLWIGRMQDFKHPERFIALADSMQDQNIEFGMIGGLGNDPLSRQVQAAAEKNSRMKLHGRVSPEVVHQKLNEVKFLVNTSDYEGFSNTFIEAWQRGVPVVSFYVDPDQMITQKNLGIVSNNPEEIKAWITDLITQPDKWETISQRCKAFAKANFEIGAAVDTLETVLKTTL